MNLLDLFWMDAKKAKEALDAVYEGPVVYCFNRSTDRMITFNKGCDFDDSRIDVRFNFEKNLVMFIDNSKDPKAPKFTKKSIGGSMTYYPLFDMLHIIVDEPKSFKSHKGTMFEIGIGLRHFIVVNLVDDLIIDQAKNDKK